MEAKGCQSISLNQSGMNNPLWRVLLSHMKRNILYNITCSVKSVNSVYQSSVSHLRNRADRMNLSDE